MEEAADHSGYACKGTGQKQALLGWGERKTQGSSKKEVMPAL
jgi:hypothetical protein